MSGQNTLPSKESLDGAIGAKTPRYPEGQTPGRTTVYEPGTDDTASPEDGVADGVPGNTMMTKEDTRDYARKHGQKIIGEEEE